MTKASPKWTEWGQSWAEVGLYTLLFMAASVPTPVHSPDHSDMTVSVSWTVAFSSTDFLIGTNQEFRQPLSVIRVHIGTHAPLSPQQRAS